MQSVEKTSWLLLLLPFLFLLTLVKDISQFAIFRLFSMFSASIYCSSLPTVKLD